MKKLLLLTILLLSSAALYVQNDVTRFLGIPVDGTESAMIEKIRAKGYTLNYGNNGKNYLTGEFNGQDVEIHVATHNNKVYRIFIIDQTSKSKSTVRTLFNELCRQFEYNPKYVPSIANKHIDADEDISYEIIVKGKKYQATFYQKANKDDPDYSVDVNRRVWFEILELHGEFRIGIFYDNGYNQAHGEDL